MITSPGCCRPLKGLFGVLGIEFHPYQLVRRKVRNGTLLGSLPKAVAKEKQEEVGAMGD
jgi:hypothetical protein